MKKTSCTLWGGYLVMMLILIAFGLAGTSDLESDRFYRSYYIAGTYK